MDFLLAELREGEAEVEVEAAVAVAMRGLPNPTLQEVSGGVVWHSRLTSMVPAHVRGGVSRVAPRTIVVEDHENLPQSCHSS